jgi:hypothetical protein
MSTMGFVVGNGESRLTVPADMYAKWDTWACNLAYRQFQPKHLVCCDRAMLVAALSDYQNHRSELWTRRRWFDSIAMEKVNQLPDLPFTQEHRWDRHMDWGSGVYAAYLACLSQHNVLLFIGFDLWGKNGRLNNVFADQQGYAAADSAEIDPSCWIYQFGRLFQNYPDKQFVFLNWPDWPVPEEWEQYDNFNTDDIRQVSNL